MSTDEKQNQTPIESQLQMLMSIRHFDRDLNTYRNAVEAATKYLVSTYEKGIISQNEENKKQLKEQLNEVQVDANQLNQVVTLAWNHRKEREGYSFEQEWKDLESRFNNLKNSALKFETLVENAEIKVFENKIEPEIEYNLNKMKPVYQFIYKHTPENLVRINEIVNHHVPESSAELNPNQLGPLYLKAFREFQREFKPQNLWDSFLELLAGGVHPSPSERVMFEKWIDGEQKTREDM